MPYVTIEEEVWVDLDDFDTDDLEEELLKRNSQVTRHSRPAPSDNTILLMNIYEKRRTGRDYQQDLDEFIYNNIGRIV
jgi:hypothetical protein